MSDWIAALREACEADSQKAVAKRIGYSQATLSQVLRGAYKGDLTRIQAAVEGALMKSTVECPVIGEIPRQRCIEHQRMSFSTSNPMRVQLYKACKVCPNRIKGK